MANVVLVHNGDGPLNEEAMLNNAWRDGGIFVITCYPDKEKL